MLIHFYVDTSHMNARSVNSILKFHNWWLGCQTSDYQMVDYHYKHSPSTTTICLHIIGMFDLYFSNTYTLGFIFLYVQCNKVLIKCVHYISIKE